MINKLSIIIPIYNLEKKYIDRLLISLDKQTSKDFEAIFIDDNSAIDFKYQIHSDIEKRNYAKIFYNNEHLGPGITRNIGIKNASYNIISFVDGDDYVTDDYVEYILNNINSKLDFLYFKHIDVYKENKEYNVNCVPSSKEFNNNYYEVSINTFKGIQPVWRYAIRKEFIINNKIWFENINVIHEDVFYVILLKTLSNRFSSSNKILYYYDRTRKGSITNTKNNNNELIFIERIISAYKWLVERKKINRMFFLYIICYLSLFIGNNHFMEYRDILINSNFYILNKEKYLNREYKALFFLYKHKIIGKLSFKLSNLKFFKKLWKILFNTNI